MVAIDADGHNLAVVDAAGRPIRYLEGTGPTVGLAMCPGRRGMVQLSAASYGFSETNLAMVVWNTDDWSRSDAVAVNPTLPGWRYFVACDDAEAWTVRMWSDAPCGERYYVVDGRATLVWPDASEPLVGDDDDWHQPRRTDRRPGAGDLRCRGRRCAASAASRWGARCPSTSSTAAVIEAGEMRMTIQNGSEYTSVVVAADGTTTVGATVPVLGFGRPNGLVIDDAALTAPPPGATPAALFAADVAAATAVAGAPPPPSSPPATSATTTPVPSTGAAVPASTAPEPGPTDEVAEGAEFEDHPTTWWLWIAVGALAIAGVAVGLNPRFGPPRSRPATPNRRG